VIGKGEGKQDVEFTEVFIESVYSNYGAMHTVTTTQTGDKGEGRKVNREYYATSQN